MTPISVFDADTKIRIYCQEPFEGQARYVLGLLKNKFAEGGIFDGVKVKFGLTLFTLKSIKDEFVVFEPNFMANPFETYNSDISLSLSILTAQRDFIEEIGFEPEEVSLQNKIVIAKGCLSEPEIYLERTAAAAENDSGWFIGYVEDDPRKNRLLKAIYVYELIKYRPELLKVLNLPVNFLVVFNDDEIQAVVDENNNEIYSRMNPTS